MTLLLSRSDIEKKISYPPMAKKQPKLPSLRSDLSMSVLNTYRQSVRDKKRNEMRSAPMLNFDIVAANKAQLANPTSSATYEEGLKLKDAKEYEDARTLLLEAVKMGITTPEIYIHIGDIYKAQTMPEEAIRYYTRALELSPAQFKENSWNHVETFKSRGVCFLMMTGSDETATRRAAEEFDKYMQIQEPTFDDLVIAGKSHLDSENLQRSEELLMKALAMDAKDAYLHFNLGELQEKKHDAKAAKYHFSQAVLCDPNFPTPYLQAAEELLAMDTSTDQAPLINALNLCLSVLKLLPTDGLLHLKIAGIYDKLGDAYLDSSLAMLSRALELSLPEDAMPGAYCRRGIIHAQKNDLDSAISDFTMSLSVDGMHSLSLINRAECCLLRNIEGDAHAAAADYEILVTCPSVDHSDLQQPFIFLALWYFDVRRGPEYVRSLQKSFEFFTQAKLKGCCIKEHKEKLMVACAVGSGFYPNSSKEAPEEPENEKEQNKVQGLCYKIVEDYYLNRKALEPTAHTALFNEFQHGWRDVKGFGKYYEGIEKAKMANDTGKGKKKKKP
eukprot:TRINITY_DN22498_c0_g1_i1.p1 TRINITY_DN22498_c0_g1~~TRINITY_DN22498_c0_g1_i1.p1  ORF type:complete len:574 (+),score=104.35 TRINITY_DN22498_c0_g1_i1:54-1724(+)